MKILFKLFAVSLLLFVTSCSSDDNENDSSNGNLNIPSWLQGKWGAEILNVENELVSTLATFKMTESTMHTIQTSTEIDVAYGSTEIEEVINNDQEYQLSVKFINTAVIYHFKKVDANTITWLTGSIPAERELVRMNNN